MKPCTFAPAAPVNQKSSAGFTRELRDERVVLVRERVRRERRRSTRRRRRTPRPGTASRSRIQAMRAPVVRQRERRVVVLTDEQLRRARFARARDVDAIQLVASGVGRLHVERSSNPATRSTRRRCDPTSAAARGSYAGLDRRASDAVDPTRIRRAPATRTR